MQMYVNILNILQNIWFKMYCVGNFWRGHNHFSRVHILLWQIYKLNVNYDNVKVFLRNTY